MKVGYILFCLMSTFGPLTLWGQGHLLLVGGNSESDGGWSDAPYGWAVAQAPNHRMAIIGVGSNNQWLPNYFQSLGATYARNFQVSDRATANSQALIDSLATYDGIFFRGGDQWDYMSAYQGSRLDSLVGDLYQRGGVIGGTSAGLAILSGVDFTAENGTVYPEEMLADWDNEFAQLSDEFLPLLPGYLFDSHFVERGRFARLLGLMAHWHIQTGERIHGIGVDDKTALCLYPDGLGLVYGTGAVNVFFDDISANGFVSSGTKPTSDGVRLLQLLDGDSLDLIAGTGHGLETPQALPIETETQPHTLLMSGSDQVSNQIDMLRYLVDELGQVDDSILLISASELGLSAALRDFLVMMPTPPPASILVAESATEGSAQALSLIQTAQKFILVANEPEQLQAFLTTGPFGQLLDQRLHADGSIVALVGDDARLAGRVYIANYRQEWASYDGLLDIQPGLGLLQTSMVMPNSFFSSTVYENTASGVPWAMVRDSLAYGWWLSQGMWVRYEVVGDSTWIRSFGARPLLMLENTGRKVDQAPFFSGFQRNIVGFEEMTIRLLDSSRWALGAIEMPVTQLPDGALPTWRVGPNPTQELVHISWTPATCSPDRWELYTQEGRLLQVGMITQRNELRLSLAAYPEGGYFLLMYDRAGAYLGRLVLMRR